MDALNRKVDGKTLLREQCYICWMTPTDAARRRRERPPPTFAPSISPIFSNWNAVAVLGRHGAGMLLIRAATRAEAETIAYAEPYTKAGMRKMALTPWQRNEGALNLRIRFADGVIEIDNRTYALGPPASG